MPISRSLLGCLVSGRLALVREIPADDRRDVRHDDPADAAGHERPARVAQEPQRLVAIEVLDEVRCVHDRNRRVVVAEASLDVAVA